MQNLTCNKCQELLEFDKVDRMAFAEQSQIFDNEEPSTVFRETFRGNLLVYALPVASDIFSLAFDSAFCR